MLDPKRDRAALEVAEEQYDGARTENRTARSSRWSEGGTDPLKNQIAQIRLPRVNRRRKPRPRRRAVARVVATRGGASHDDTANLFRKPVLDDILLLAMLGSVPAVRRSRTLSK